MKGLPIQFREIVGTDARMKYFSGNPVKNWLLDKFFERIFKLVQESGAEDKKILEIGCGDGIAGYLITNRFSKAEYLGGDININDLLAAQRILADPRLVLLEGRKLPLKDKSFEIVICLEVFEHVKNWEEVLREALRVARNQVIFSVPVFPYFQILNFLAGNNWKRFGEHPDHVNQFRMKQLEGRLNELFRDKSGRGENYSFELVFSFPWCIADLKIQE